MSSNIIVIRERDEWSSLAEFLGNMIAKYADEIDFDSLPDPDEYILRTEGPRWYKMYLTERHKINKPDIEFQIVE